MANRATTILDRANAKKAELAALNVTQTNLDELTKALHDFKSSKEKPREAVATRSAETQSLTSLIRQANDIMRNRIDPMVNLFRRSDSKFVAAFRSARVVVDRPGDSRSVQAAYAADSIGPPSGGPCLENPTAKIVRPPSPCL